MKKSIIILTLCAVFVGFTAAVVAPLDSTHTLTAIQSHPGATDTIVTSTTHTTIFNTIQQSLDATHWLLLFLGLAMYWLKTLNAARQACAGKPFFLQWFNNNWIEIPTSMIACLVLAIMAKDVPTDFIDLRGSIAVFLAGYSSSSILNSLITSGRRAVPTTDQEDGPKKS